MSITTPSPDFLSDSEASEIGTFITFLYHFAKYISESRIGVSSSSVSPFQATMKRISADVGV